MRLNLYWRGRDVIDIEMHIWKKRDEESEAETPKLEAVGYLADSSRAEATQPDTTTFGFGTRPESRR